MRGSDLGFTFQHPCLSLSPFSLLGPGVKANLAVAPMSSSMALRLRPKYITTTNTSFIHCFSSSSTSDPNDTNPKDATPTSSDSSPKSQSSFASYFSDVKSSLKQQKQPHSQTQPRKSSFNTSTTKTPSTAASLGEIRKNLSEFRLRSAVPPPNETKDTTSPPSEQISFQELYKRNVAAKSSESPPEPGKDGRASFSLDAIRESLKQLKSSTPAAPNTDRRGSDAMSLSKYKESFKIRPQSGNVIGGGFETLPTSVFGKEMKEKNEGKSSTSASDMKTDFMKTYSFGELGEKMRMLRPEKEVDFSLDELNARLMKLREIEAKETESRKVGGVTFKDLRESLVKLKLSSEEKEKQTQIQKLGYLGQLGGTPNFMLAPPKEQLVEKYFHPDNLSSAEKLKIELQKVRDEFKMSESDCGSARVQVAQLTTKIKHLASVLHKKDKHSRKGLQEMVQRRKKLLKYLRRTDWDSFCLVLSKLGLRDNPDYKH